MLHIEFIGAPGSGKSAICEAVVNKLQDHKCVTCLTDDKAFFEVSKKKIDRFYRFFLNFTPRSFAMTFSQRLVNRSLMQFDAQNNFLAKYGNSLLAYLSSDGFNDVAIYDKKNSISFFLTTGSLFEVISNQLRDCAVFYSEGFVQKSFMFLHPCLKLPPQRDLVGKYLENIPHPDMLIRVKVDPVVCLARMKARPRGLPLRLREVPEDEILGFLKRSETHLTTVLELLRQHHNIKTIEIDNSVNLDAAVSHAYSLICQNFNW